MKQQINLYRALPRRERAPFSALTMAAGLAGCAVCLLGGWAFAGMHAAGLERELQLVQRQEDAAAARLGELTSLLDSRRDTEGEATSLQAALDALARSERLLAMLDGPGAGSTRGFSDALDALARYGVDGLWLTRVSVSAPGMRTTLEGRTLTPELVPEYLLGLSAQGALNGQRFDQFDIERSSDDGEPGLRFAMTSQAAERTAAGTDSR